MEDEGESGAGAGSGGGGGGNGGGGVSRPSVPQMSLYERQAVQALQALQRQPNAAAQYLQQMYAAQHQQLLLQQHLSSAQLQNLAAAQQVTLAANRQVNSTNTSESQSIGASQSTVNLTSPAMTQPSVRPQSVSSPVTSVLLGPSSPSLSPSQAKMYLQAQVVARTLTRTAPLTHQLILMPGGSVAAVQPELASAGNGAHCDSEQAQNLAVRSQGPVPLGGGGGGKAASVVASQPNVGSAQTVTITQASSLNLSQAPAPGKALPGADGDAGQKKLELKVEVASSTSPSAGINLARTVTPTGHTLISSAATYTQIQPHALLHQQLQQKQLVIQQQHLAIHQHRQSQLAQLHLAQPHPSPHTQTLVVQPLSQAQAQTEAQKQAQAQTEAQKQTQAQTEAQKQAQAQAQTEALKQAQAQNEALKQGQAQTEAFKQAQSQTEASKQAQSQTEASKQVQSQTEASKQAQSQTEALKQAQAQTEALKQAQAQNEALKQAKTQTEGQKQAQAQAEALKQAQAQTEALKQAQAQTEALKQAQAQTEALKQAQAQTEALKQAQAQTEALKQAQAQTEALKQAQAQTEALKQAQAQTETQKQAQAQTEALKQAQTQTESQKQAHCEPCPRQVPAKASAKPMVGSGGQGPASSSGPLPPAPVGVLQASASTQTPTSGLGQGPQPSAASLGAVGLGDPGSPQLPLPLKSAVMGVKRKAEDEEEELGFSNLGPPELSPSQSSTAQELKPSTTGKGDSIHVGPPVLTSVSSLLKVSRHGGDGKPPQAIVKPHILTHVIEGFVIQEGAEPFPVDSTRDQANSKQKSQDPPVLQPETQLISEHLDSEPIPLAGSEVSQEMLKCEFCGQLEQADKFKRSKRFCSMACAKRYNVSCRKGVRRFTVERVGQISKDTTRGLARRVSRKETGETIRTGLHKRLAKGAEESGRVSDNSSYEETVSPLSPGLGSLRPAPFEREAGGCGSGAPETPGLGGPANPGLWSVQEVSQFISSLPGCQDLAEEFQLQEIDGQALLLLKEEHLMTTMNMKLGPALKICARINLLKES